MPDELKLFHIILILGGGMQWYYEHRRYKRWIYMGEIIELNAVAFFISSFAKNLIITIQSIQNWLLNWAFLQDIAPLSCAY